MLKGHLDTIVLAALAAGPAHGYAVIEAIRTGSGETFDVPEGTLYPALHRLEAAGLLASEWTVPPSGRKRRVYALTPAGREALARRRALWERFARGVDAIVSGGRPWPA